MSTCMCSVSSGSEETHRTNVHILLRYSYSQFVGPFTKSSSERSDWTGSQNLFTSRRGGEAVDTAAHTAEGPTELRRAKTSDCRTCLRTLVCRTDRSDSELKDRQSAHLDRCMGESSALLIRHSYYRGAGQADMAESLRRVI